MLVGIEVGDAVGLDSVLEGGLALARRVVGASTSGVVGAVAIDVEVVVSVVALQEDCALANVTAVDGASGEGTGKLVVTLSGLVSLVATLERILPNDLRQKNGVIELTL